MAAETTEILEKIRDMSERRMSDLQDAELAREQARWALVNDKISTMERMRALADKVEPSALAKLTGAFEPEFLTHTAPRKVSGPTRRVRG